MVILLEKESAKYDNCGKKSSKILKRIRKVYFWDKRLENYISKVKKKANRKIGFFFANKMILNKKYCYFFL